MRSHNVQFLKNLAVGQKTADTPHPHYGYLLIELMVAMTIFTIGFLAVMGLTANAVSTTRVITDSFTANYLAMEGIEIVKSFLDENTLSPDPWNQGFNNEQCYALDYTGDRRIVNPCPPPGFLPSVLSGQDLVRSHLKYIVPTGFYDHQGGPLSIVSPFYRVVYITPESPPSRYLKVESIVAWVGRGGAELEVRLEDYFFDQK